MGLKNNIASSIGVWLLAILVLGFFSNCKWINERNKSGSVLQDQIIVEVYLTVPEDDLFELYYRNENQEYSSDNRIETEVSGSQQTQKVRFILNQQTFPSHIRLDLGVNREQGPMALDRIVLSYNETSEVLGKSEIKKYFRSNRYLDFDFELMTVSPKEVDDKYDPYLDSNNISKFVNNLILH